MREATAGETVMFTKFLSLGQNDSTHLSTGGRILLQWVLGFSSRNGTKNKKCLVRLVETLLSVGLSSRSHIAFLIVGQVGDGGGGAWVGDTQPGEAIYSWRCFF